MGKIHELLKRAFTRTYMLILLVLLCICIIAGYFEYTGLGFDRSVVNFNSRFSGALCTMSLTHYFVITRIKKVIKRTEFDTDTLKGVSLMNLGLSLLLFAFTEAYLVHSVLATSLGESPAHATAYFIFTILIYCLTFGLIFHVTYALDEIMKSVRIKYKRI